MVSIGDNMKCCNCGYEIRIDMFGKIQAINFNTFFDRIDKWYNWQFLEQSKEIYNIENYCLKSNVQLYVNDISTKDFKFLDKGELMLDKHGYKFVGLSGKVVVVSIHYSPYIALRTGLWIDFFIDETIYRFVFSEKEKGLPCMYSVATETLFDKNFKKII